MKPETFNPYAPPTTTGPIGRSAARRRIGVEVALRALAVIVGFSLVADPLALPGITSALGRALGGHVLARGIGLALLAAGFLPWRRQGPARSGDPAGTVGEEL